MTTRRSTRFRCLGLVVGMLAAAGCNATIEPPEEPAVSKLRHALPSSAEMAINLPESNALVAEQATFYGFTRAITVNVNGLVWGITRLVEQIVERPPTSLVGEDQAVWGPYQDALSPAAWRVTVNREAAGSYRYVVEGWPRRGGPADARTVLEGTHRDGAGLHRGSGSFTYHLTVAHELDPTTQDSLGEIQVDFTLSETRALAVSFLDVQGPQDAMVNSTLYRYTEAADGAGTFDFISNADIDENEPNKDRRELLQVRSRWLPTGPGRTDALASHGDLPQGMQADVAECWDQAFVRTYSRFVVANVDQQDGELAACPYADRQLPTFEGFDAAAFADADLVAAVPEPADFEAGFSEPELPLADPQAHFYVLTREMVSGVNGQVQGVLGLVREVLKNPPSDCRLAGCTWGPWTDRETDVTTRLSVDRLGGGRFAFRSEVKRFGAADDAWALMLQGEMSEAAATGDGDGWFVHDLDVLHELQPTAQTGGQLRAELSSHDGQVQLAVRFDQVVWEDQPVPTDVRYLLQLQADGTGSLDLRFPGNVDEQDPAKVASESLEVHSRWLPSAAGVATVKVSGGDSPAGQVAYFAQCWDSHTGPLHDAYLLQPVDGTERPALDEACAYTDFVDPSFPPMADEAE